MARTLRDLQRLTGRSRDTCIAAIESGQAPGYKMGRGYTIPDEAFELFAKGQWNPVNARTTVIHPLPTPADMVRRRGRKEDAPDLNPS